MELHSGVDPCQGSSLSSPHGGHQETNCCPIRERDDDDEDRFAGLNKNKEEIETNYLAVEDDAESD